MTAGPPDGPRLEPLGLLRGENLTAAFSPDESRLAVGEQSAEAGYSLRCVQSATGGELASWAFAPMRSAGWWWGPDGALWVALYGPGEAFVLRRLELPGGGAPAERRVEGVGASPWVWQRSADGRFCLLGALEREGDRGSRVLVLLDLPAGRVVWRRAERELLDPASRWQRVIASAFHGDDASIVLARCEPPYLEHIGADGRVLGAMSLGPGLPGAPVPDIDNVTWVGPSRLALVGSCYTGAGKERCLYLVDLVRKRVERRIRRLGVDASFVDVGWLEPSPSGSRGRMVVQDEWGGVRHAWVDLELWRAQRMPPYASAREDWAWLADDTLLALTLRDDGALAFSRLGPTSRAPEPVGLARPFDEALRSPRCFAGRRYVLASAYTGPTLSTRMAWFTSPAGEAPTRHRSPPNAG